MTSVNKLTRLESIRAKVEAELPGSDGGAANAKASIVMNRATRQLEAPTPPAASRDVEAARVEAAQRSDKVGKLGPDRVQGTFDFGMTDGASVSLRLWVPGVSDRRDLSPRERQYAASQLGLSVNGLGKVPVRYLGQGGDYGNDFVVELNLAAAVKAQGLPDGGMELELTLGDTSVGRVRYQHRAAAEAVRGAALSALLTKAHEARGDTPIRTAPNKPLTMELPFPKGREYVDLNDGERAHVEGVLGSVNAMLATAPILAVPEDVRIAVSTRDPRAWGKQTPRVLPIDKGFHHIAFPSVYLHSGAAIATAHEWGHLVLRETLERASPVWRVLREINTRRDQNRQDLPLGAAGVANEAALIAERQRFDALYAEIPDLVRDQSDASPPFEELFAEALTVVWQRDGRAAARELEAYGLDAPVVRRADFTVPVALADLEAHVAKLPGYTHYAQMDPVRSFIWQELWPKHPTRPVAILELLARAIQRVQEDRLLAGKRRETRTELAAAMIEELRRLSGT